MNPFFVTDFSISDSLKTVRKSVLIYETIIGFPATILRKGISPFSRNEISDSEHFGMGLYICKLLCEKHGGSLTIEKMEHGAKTTAVFNF